MNINKQIYLKYLEEINVKNVWLIGQCLKVLDPILEPVKAWKSGNF